MKISQFTTRDLDKARDLVIRNYGEEREANTDLPKVDNIPDMYELAENGLGVAMYEGDEMLGFLCTEISERFEALRAFCPIHGHGAVKKDRDKIYSRLYQAAAGKWLKEGALTHEVTLFSHDYKALDSFFYNVFGACVMYAVMDIKNKHFEVRSIEGIEMCELDESRYFEIRELQNGLLSHLRKTPIFLPYLMETEETFARIKYKRYFAALKDNRVIAYIRLQENARTFVACEKGTINISGAFMYPEFRGSGIYSQLLMYLIRAMKEEGRKRISVDFETYNPNAMRFWTKNFTPYTTTLTRKAEPRILTTPGF